MMLVATKNLSYCSFMIQNNSLKIVKSYVIFECVCLHIYARIWDICICIHICEEYLFQSFLNKQLLYISECVYVVNTGSFFCLFFSSTEQ